ncbi:hypothetical protein BGX28_008156 [Mortierella sp. GBA30]|nr:hypothetical protein BGX28_008156 [Mortierella sp. GBA30]
MAETQIATATATATAAEASAQQVTFNGSFLCLREFHLHGRRRRPTFDESEDLDMMIEFVSRSGPSLEVLRFDVAGNDGTISPKMLSHLSRCVNLRILSFTTDCFVHSYLENGDPSVCLSMLVESRVLEKLTRLRSLNVRISEFAHDLLGYASVILGEHCSEDEDGMWEHRVDYLRNLYDFCRSVKALKNLERLDLRWDKCDIVDVMTVDEMLLFLNKDEFDMARTLEAPITLDDLIRVNPYRPLSSAGSMQV